MVFVQGKDQLGNFVPNALVCASDEDNVAFGAHCWTCVISELPSTVAIKLGSIDRSPHELYKGFRELEFLNPSNTNSPRRFCRKSDPRKQPCMMHT